MNNLTVITLNKPGVTDFAAARNRELSQVKTDWALFLDQDEALTPELKQEIEVAIQSAQYDGYYLKRSDTFLGKKLQYGETANGKFLRLAKTKAGKWVRPVHEVWEVKGRVGELKNPLLHHPHPSLSSFLSKIDHYSTLEAQYRRSLRVRSTLLHLFFYPLGKFLKNYLLLQGFRDGIPGLIMAIAMSFHSYLTWAKLYLLWRQK